MCLFSSYLKSFSPYGSPFLYTSPNCSLPKEESFPFHHEKKVNKEDKPDGRKVT